MSTIWLTFFNLYLPFYTNIPTPRFKTDKLPGNGNFPYREKDIVTRKKCFSVLLYIAPEGSRFGPYSLNPVIKRRHENQD